ncbi:MAG: OmpA family protein [Vicinamibacterales bacterium]|jgi:outer membrane protein OmpA-like peptidoglycan-associated protein
MAPRPTLTLLAVVAALVAATGAQPPPFPQPQSTPETVTDAQDFPYIPALPGARLISTKRIYAPLELKQATAEDEAVLAGMSYVQKTYDRPGSITAIAFISAFRDALFAAGWMLIDVTKLEEIPILGRRPVRRSLGEGGQPETVNVAAHYSAQGRIVYARMTQEPGGPYQVNVADVGAEDWSTALAKECRVLSYSIHFDLDRATLRPEATATLEKLADVLKARSAPAVEVQGHIDNVGAAEEAARQLLSEARARTVAAWLAAHGVPASKLSSKGYGKTRPLAANDSDLGRAMNRRIEIVRKGCSR